MTPDLMLDEQEPTAWDAIMAEHERQLVIGARVRIRLSAECPHPHVMQENGVTGVINYLISQEELDIDNAKAPDDPATLADVNYHIWSVEYDDPKRVPFNLGPFKINDMWETEGLYLAAELVLRAADPDDGGED